MSNPFTDRAKRSNINPITQDKEKRSIDDIIASYPQGVTITGFILKVSKDGAPYAQLNIAEDATIFFNGGTVLTRICEDWLQAFDGDIARANIELQKAGGARFKIYWGKNKEGRNMVKADVID